MKNYKNTARLKNLFSIAGIALAFGACLNSTDAHAFSRTCPDPNFSLTLNLTPFHVQRTFFDCDNNNEIKFFTPQNGRVDIDGALYRRSGIYTLSTGQSVQGTVLNLTNLTIRNLSQRNLNLTNLISFQDNFTFGSNTSQLIPVFAHQLIEGSFNGGTSNLVKFTGSLNGVDFPTLSSFNSQHFFSRSIQPQPRNVRNPLRVRGFLRPVQLNPRRTLTMSDSACILVLDRAVADNEARRICDRVASVPEPSSIIGLLAVGAFGGGFLLKRRRKSSSEQ
jgi:PEP-CTERM motif